MTIPRLARDILAGLAAGIVVLGIGGRLLMRGIAVATGTGTGFSWGGTFEVILFGAIVGLAAGLVYSLILTRFIKKPVWRAVVLGLGAYLVLAVLPYDVKMAITAFPESVWFPITLSFAVLFLLFGLGVEKLAQRP